MSGSEKRHRSESLKVRCSLDEASAIRDKAQECGVSVSEFMRACALGRRIGSATDSQVVRELRRLGGLQKHLFNLSGGVMHSREYAEILVAIKQAVIRIAGAESAGVETDAGESAT